jgi:hypothetical protein
MPKNFGSRKVRLQIAPGAKSDEKLIDKKQVARRNRMTLYLSPKGDFSSVVPGRRTVAANANCTFLLCGNNWGLRRGGWRYSVELLAIF